MTSAQPESGMSYLYCVTHRQPFTGDAANFKTTGIAGRPVRIVAQDDLAAIVSDSPSDEYNVTLENVQAHEGVIEEAMQRTDVLPISFGSVAGSDEEVRTRLLQDEAQTLRSQLESIEGHVEMGVRALWEQEALFAQITAEDSDIQALSSQIVGTTPEETYDLRLELGELTDQAIQRHREQDAAAILDALSPLAADTRANSIITDMMVVNASFLVARDKVETFIQNVNALQQANAGRLILQCVGPLPPYNFVTMHMQWGEPTNAVTQ